MAQFKFVTAVWVKTGTRRYGVYQMKPVMAQEHFVCARTERQAEALFNAELAKINATLPKKEQRQVWLSGRADRNFMDYVLGQPDRVYDPKEVAA